MSIATYAPDLVKWTQRDMKKIMNIGKPPDEDK